MNADQMLDPHRWWYGARQEQLVAGLIALDDVYDAASRLQRRDLLEMVLPGVADVLGCWGELSDVLRRLRDLDGRTAVDVLRERGEYSGLSMDRQDAEDRVRAELMAEVRDTISRYGIPPLTTEHAAFLAVAR